MQDSAFDSGKEICEIVVPRFPLLTNDYRCDNRFQTELIRSLCIPEGVPIYGLVLVYGGVTHFYTVQSSSYRLLKTQTSRIPKKQKKGGSSANRIARLRDELVDHYFFFFG